MRPRRRPGWFAVIAALVIGLCIGVGLVVGLAEINHGKRRHHSATSARPPVGPSVPGVVGERLDQANADLKNAGYNPEVGDGGGLLGPIVESNWQVTGQSPQAGSAAPGGTTVTLSITHL